MSAIDEAARHARFLQQTIASATRHTQDGHGGPFAALVVKSGAVIASGFNTVTSTNDPTAHAEVQAIRAACQTLGTFQLADCDVYSSCEPCPMCLGALYWARPRAVYFAATRADAAAGGFDDSFVYDELGKPPAGRTLPFCHVPLAEAGQPFAAWLALAGKIRY